MSSHLKNIEGMQMEGKLARGAPGQHALPRGGALRAFGRPAPGHREAGPRHRGGLALPDASGRHRVRQDLHHGQDHRGGAEAYAGHGAEQDAWPPSWPPSSRSSSRTTRWCTSSATTTTTSRKPTCPRRTPSSRRTPPSTRRWRSCAMRPRARCCPRRDCIVVASVSAASTVSAAPWTTPAWRCFVDKQKEMDRDQVIHELIDIQYDRNDYELKRGTFRVRGDALDIFPPYADNPVRVEFWGDEIERIAEVELRHRRGAGRLRGAAHLARLPLCHRRARRWTGPLPPSATSCATACSSSTRKASSWRPSAWKCACSTIWKCWRPWASASGIENYSRHLDGRAPGEPPYTLIDYFPDDFLCIIDESHVTVPQIRGMHEGDRSRKVTLAEHGFRLPSCLDNRPLRFDEFEERIPQFVYVSATPGDYEEKVSQQQVEQIIRPTGLLDPQIIIAQQRQRRSTTSSMGPRSVPPARSACSSPRLRRRWPRT